MSLIMNGLDAMKDVEGARELGVRTQRENEHKVLVAVTDAAPYSLK